MSIERTKMIAALKEIFIPELRKMSFKGSFPHFRRTIDTKTNLLTFQFDKNGGGFIIELANYNKFEYKTSWGEIIPLHKLTAHDLDNRQRVYLKTPTKQDEIGSCFMYDKKRLFILGNKYNRLSHKVVQQIPVMEVYWDKI